MAPKAAATVGGKRSSSLSKGPAAKAAAPKGVKAPSAKAAAPEAAKPKAEAGPAQDLPNATTPALPAADVAESLTVKDAQDLLRSLTPFDIIRLADSTEPVEQLAVCYALPYVGDKDLSWSNAQNSLRQGTDFITEILQMDGGDFMTKGCIEKMVSLGSLNLKMLEERNKVAYALAVYFKVCLKSARKRMGLDDEPDMQEPAPDESPPEWPQTISFAKISEAVVEAARWKKTALLVCGGNADKVDTFFCYRACSSIDAKWLLSEVSIKKNMSVEQAQEELRKRVVNSLKFGQPLHIAMSNSAVALKQTYCDEDFFAEGIFCNKHFDEEAVYKKMIRESDLADWVGAFPGRKREGSYSFVVSDFDLNSAQEFLPACLPYFEEMAVYVIDPASIS